MRKRIVSLLLLLGCMILLTAGCNQNAEDTALQSKAGKTAEVETVSIPTEAPVLTGRVKEIIGNEVTIYKMATADNLQSGPPNREKPLDQVKAEEVRVNDSVAETTDNQDTSSDPVGQKPIVNEETETFLIPVGAPIAGMSIGEADAAALSLSDIAAGSMIRVWKTDGTITLVQVMGGGKSQTRNTETETDQMMPGGPPGGFGGGGAPPGAGGGSGITQSLGGAR